MKNKKKAQSTLEYVLLVTAVIVVAISFTMQSNSGVQQAVNDVISDGLTGMTSMSDNIRGASTGEPAQ